MKYILQKLENNEVVKTREFKTFRTLAEFMNIDYYLVRQLYQLSIKPSKYLHPKLKNLSSLYKILDLEQDINIIDF